MKPRFPLLACAIAASLFFAGCISVPVAARTSRGEKFIGSANATLVGGTFDLVSANGTHCYGNYNPWSHPGGVKQLAFKSNDGRYGTGTLALNPDGKSGIGVGQANDGTTFDFTVGSSIQQIHYEW